jgi:lipopolysaccharide/colanic/teichoic acid biosynthesis glycosyltransferase
MLKDTLLNGDELCDPLSSGSKTPAPEIIAPSATAAFAPVARSAGSRVAGENLKRVLDVVGALLLFAATAPLLVLIVIALKLSGNGSVIFWQERVGCGGDRFWFPKFASMRHGSDELDDALRAHSDHDGSITFKMRHDPRVTRLGRLLRISSVDEIPQLWCVLRGDMSLVGPRPPLPREVAHYTLEQRRRLEAKPGLTCIWQVSGRSEIPFEGQVALDLDYIDNQSLWLDLKLLLRTIPAVVSCRGAY